MAKTQGHGNPPWNRDETILALDLYFETAGVASSTDARVIALSATLRSLPYHGAMARRATFRNSAGVAFKVQNLRQVATGKGLGNVSAMDRAIWQEFMNNHAEAKRLAKLIREGIVAVTGAEEDTEENLQFYEGRLILHTTRERNRRVRSGLLKARAKEGLRCEICDFTYEHLAPRLREAVFEVHHVVPVAEAGERSLKLSDVALLCASCHRATHGAISLNQRWYSIDEMRLLMRPAS